ncbi:hypothetical protein SOVF_014380 [Spinacia oleracea]|nr:hypothetical protein SOVF_014380 [Spinacia oleracea]
MEDDDQPPTFEELLLLEELLESGQLSDDDLLDVDIPTMDFLSMEQQMNQFRDDEASQAEVWYLSDDDNNVDYEAMHNVYDEHIHSDIISSYFQNMQPSETSNTNRNHGKKTFELSDNQRAVMVAKLMLLANKDMTLPWGVAKKLANEYDTVEVPDDLLTSIRQYMQEGQININEFRQRVNEMGVRVEDPYQNGRHQ